jgi:hypothetical protein
MAELDHNANTARAAFKFPESISSQPLPLTFPKRFILLITFPAHSKAPHCKLGILALQFPLPPTSSSASNCSDEAIKPAGTAIAPTPSSKQRY